MKYPALHSDDFGKKKFDNSIRGFFLRRSITLAPCSESVGIAFRVGQKTKKILYDMSLQNHLGITPMFQVPKREVLNPIRQFLGWVFPCISLTYSLYRWVPPFWVPEMFGDGIHRISYSGIPMLGSFSYCRWSNSVFQVFHHEKHLEGQTKRRSDFRFVADFCSNRMLQRSFIPDTLQGINISHLGKR